MYAFITYVQGFSVDRASLSFIKTSYTGKINELAMSSFGNVG